MFPEVVVGGRVPPLTTSRLVLEPVSQELARAVVTGDLSGIRRAAGWPHADTADAMALALGPDAGPSWVITVDGEVIGDCGGFSWPDAGGAVEIGYGLAEPYRDRGYATEAAAAVCQWLFAEAGATVITATTVDPENAASRRVLEKLGFELVGDSFRLTRA